MEKGVQVFEESDSLSGKYCYFPRDLGLNSYGGDVSCLQQFLSHEGYFDEEPTGFFGSQTKDAVAKWQKAAGIAPAEGYVGFPTRLAYAKRHKLPTAEQMRAVEASLDNDSVTEKLCIDVYSAPDESGTELCETRCVSFHNDLALKCVQEPRIWVLKAVKSGLSEQMNKRCMPVEKLARSLTVKHVTRYFRTRLRGDPSGDRLSCLVIKVLAFPAGKTFPEGADYKACLRKLPSVCKKTCAHYE